MNLPLSLLALFSILFLIDAIPKTKDVDGLLDDDDNDSFQTFNKANKRKACTDGTADCKKRKGNFARNSKKFKDIQARNKKQGSSFEVKMHPAMDESDDELNSRLIPLDTLKEFQAKYQARTGGKRKHIDRTGTRTKRSIPASFDWRTIGGVGPIRDQQSCGDCWAFAATSAVEILDNVYNCRLYTMQNYSDQYTTDCTYYNASASTQRNGCQGGWCADAFDYIIKKGITTQAADPFINKQGVCPTTPNPKYTPIKDQMDLTGDVQGMMNFIATTGPITIAIIVCDDFQYYASGVYDNAACTSGGGHAMTLLGYGTLNGVDYWLARNQWGTQWGDKGYWKIKRGVDMIKIESMGVFAPVPTTNGAVCVSQTGATLFKPLPACSCTAPKTTAPASPFSTQTIAGTLGTCSPRNVALPCTGTGHDLLQTTLYDDKGAVILDTTYCAAWGYKWNAQCETTAGSGSTLNYGTYGGKHVANAVCKNWGSYPQYC